MTARDGKLLFLTDATDILSKLKGLLSSQYLVKDPVVVLNGTRHKPAAPTVM